MAFNIFNFWMVFPFIFGLYWLISPKYNLWWIALLIVMCNLLYINWKTAFGIDLLGVAVGDPAYIVKENSVLIKRKL